MIIGLVSDFLPECKSKISFGLFIHHSGIFGVKDLSMFLKFIVVCLVLNDASTLVGH